MKRVLHISNYYLPNHGGIEQAAYDVVKCLENEYEQKVICFNEGNETIRDLFDGVEVIRVGHFKKYFSQAVSLYYFHELKKIIQKFGPDIIHVHLPNPLITIYLLGINKIKNSKIIIHWHSDIINQKNLLKFYLPIQNKILKEADLILATSEKYIKESSYLKVFQDKVEILPNVVDFSKFNLNSENRKKVNEIKEKYQFPIIFFLGRHIEYKGIEYLIEAAKHIEKNVKILIAGTGLLTDKLKEIAADINNIEFLGRLSNEEVKEHLYAADIFAFPSITKNEAFGIALAEALYCGTPSVCFDIPGSGVSWVNQNKITGFVVENKNIEKFVEAIETILKNPELKGKMSENATDWAKRKFNRESMKKKLLHYYSQF